MRTRWTRLLENPPVLVGVGVLVVALVVGGVLLLRDGTDDARDPSAAAAASEPAPDEPSGAEDGDAQDAPPSPLPPDPDRYCPAYAEIREGGLSTPGSDEDAPVDLAELATTFERLIDRYEAAARVAPVALRDDYAQALQYLRQGRRATSTQDVDLLRALVVNLDSLDDTIGAIQTVSDRLCD